MTTSWAGQVPRSWAPLPLRRALRRVEQGWSPVAEDRIADFDEWAVIKLSAVSRGAFQENEHKALSIDTVPETRFEIRPGDVLLTRANTPELVGDACYVVKTRRRLMLCDLAYRLTVDSTVLEPRFLTYWLLGDPGRGQIVADARGSSQSMVKVSQGHIRSWLIPLPGVDTQRAVVRVLDRKTAAIDALIAKKERLIELLQERRQALITQAVTKGLDPNVPMKDSEIDWVGQVPAHWRRVRLSYVARVCNGSTPDRNCAEYWSDGSIPWLSSGKVNDYYVTEADEFITTRALRETSVRLLPKGTVLVGMIGQGKTRGTSAFLMVDACINQNVAGVTPRAGINGRYLHHVFVAAYQSLREYGRGGQQDALNCDILKAFRIPLPPLQEQQRIAAFLDHARDTTLRLCDLVQLHVAKLREYRQALITAAVTGQLDVSNEAA